MSELEALVAACRSHGTAVEKAQRAGDARALAVHRARVAGVTLGTVAQVLGCARAAVPPLARRGAALAGEAREAMTHSPESTQPQGGGGGEVMTVSSESTRGPYVTFEVVRGCLRDGCRTAASAGSDLCPEHLWA